ncbi:enzymatic polyprotein [Labeo rohita]|uniref:Enzymatic polyprotein n=1 Tax=Labeo rohita TaxID=84645 RepID=A0ABQ8L6Z8_LABRO|nr:enzymatic polyprotein [Labeo rohita]
MGKAKDVVRVTLRCNSALNPVENPKVIMDILKQHFSDVSYSCMPLADFYGTVPLAGEGPVEYWVRLNKAVDLAEEALKRLGRRMEDPCQEAAMMFMKYCPDPTLASVFRFKAPEKWTAQEIQEQLDRYQTELKEQMSMKPKRHATTRHVTAHVQTSHEADEVDVGSPAEPDECSRASPTHTVQSDDNCMRTLISLLDRALSQNVQMPSHQPHSKLCRGLISFKLGGSRLEGGCVNTSEEPLGSVDLHQFYENACAQAPTGTKVIAQNVQTVEAFDELFYAPVSVNNVFSMKGMLDTGSMACTLSDKAEKRMLSENVLPTPTPLQQEVILVGCGGKVTRPTCMYEVELKIYGESCLVPILVVPGQRDDLIIGTNVIKFLAHRMKGISDYWRLVSNQTVEPMTGCEQFLDVMANTCRWKGSELPDKVGTIKLQQCVTLLARQEHLVWGKLPKNIPMSPGSTVVVEPTTSRCASRDIMIGRVVTPLWGDRWVPVKVTNFSDKPVTLKRNRKLADVFPCVAVEDFEIFQGLSRAEVFEKGSQHLSNSSAAFRQRLETVGLADLDIQSCSVSHETREKLVQLLERYNDVFSKHALDCGEHQGLCSHAFG